MIYPVLSIISVHIAFEKRMWFSVELYKNYSIMLLVNAVNEKVNLVFPNKSGQKIFRIFPLTQVKSKKNHGTFTST